MASNSVLAKMSVLISTNQAEFARAMHQNSNALKSFESSFMKLNSVMSSFGIGFSALLVVGIFKDAIKSIADFEKELSTVKAITGATGKQFEDLKKNALSLGASTRYTSTQVAGLQVAYGRLGFTTSEILNATKATLDLATATGEDLAKSADVAGSTLRAFELNASETVRVVDVMASSFNKSALNLENFSESMKYVAPVAKAAGATIEETTALLATLADSGIRGSMAGTSLRKIFTEMSKDGRPLVERLKELGDRGISMKDAFDEVGRTAQTSLLILAKNTDKIKDLSAAFNDAAGEGDKMARIMEDNLTGDVVKLTSAYDGLIQSSGAVTGIMREMVQGLTKVLAALNSNNGALGVFVAKWARLATIVPRTIINVAGATAEFFSETDKGLDDQEAKLKAIESTVKAAFDSGNVEAYIKALERNIYKEEIIAEIRRIQAEELKKSMEALTNQQGIIAGIEAQLKTLEESKKNAFSVSEIANYNAQIEKLRQQLELLNATRPLSKASQSKNLGPKEGLKTGSDFLAATGGFIVPPDITPQTDAIISNYVRSGEALRQWAISAGISHDMVTEKMNENIQTAVTLGDAIGSALGDAAAGAQSFADGLRGVAQSIIAEFRKIAIAAIIKNAAVKGGHPVAAIALAVAGFAAISKLFSLIGSSSSGGGGGTSIARAATSRSDNFSSSLAKNAAQNSNPTLETVIRGQDLYVILSNYQRNSSQTRAVG